MLFDEKRAKLLVEKGKFDEAAAQAALKNVQLGGGNRIP